MQNIDVLEGKLLLPSRDLYS